MSVTSFYVDRDTVLHRLTGRAKLALALGASIAATVFSAPWAVGMLLVVILATVLAVGGRRNLLKIWHIVGVLMIVGVAVWPSFVPDRGATIVSFSGVRLTVYEFRFALGRAIRVATYLLVGLGFITTTSNEELVSELRSLGFPYALCFAVGTALRLVPTLFQTTKTVQQAQAARGHDLTEGRLIERIRRYVPVLIPVLMTALRRVHTRSMALESRGFDPARERTFYARQSFSRRDWIAVGVAMMLAVGSMTLSAVGVGSL